MTIYKSDPSSSLQHFTISFYYKNHQSPCTMQIHSPNTKFSNILQIRSAHNYYVRHACMMHVTTPPGPLEISSVQHWLLRILCKGGVATIPFLWKYISQHMRFMKPHKLDTVAVTDFNFNNCWCCIGLIKISHTAECISCGCDCSEYTCP